MAVIINTEDEHRKLWCWMSETGSERKRKYPEFKELPLIPCWCFACITGGSDCGKCPIDWGKRTCFTAGSYYDKWYRSWDVDGRKKYAKIISELPWNGHKDYIYDTCGRVWRELNIESGS